MIPLYILVFLTLLLAAHIFLLWLKRLITKIALNRVAPRPKKTDPIPMAWRRKKP